MKRAGRTPRPTTHLHDRQHAPGVGPQALGQGVGDEVVVLGGGGDGQEGHERQADLVEGGGLGDLGKGGWCGGD